ncbi:hypothetical protein [Methanocaldococcus fervens]|uniref:Uncharacterized protein n=1 Tax=Methanocaldococcus fervens (strain DSM 4213 / JCM 15782 / AG86) TaxID=573064 RepID=C7P9Q5_METFA|nr:hypothetical protein [Methanocaldococcus fervens]ACV25412.1 hypothetical protein Mefer_1609 [Methanocaldococcus fervens AG86]
MNAIDIKKELTRIDVICDELLELETTKRVKKIRDGLLKIKEIVKRVEDKEICECSE